jgi:hypothetical protein
MKKKLEYKQIPGFLNYKITKQTIILPNCILETQSITKEMVYIYIHIYITTYMYIQTQIYMPNTKKPPKYITIKRITHAHNNTANLQN